MKIALLYFAVATFFLGGDCTGKDIAPCKRAAAFVDRYGVCPDKNIGDSCIDKCTKQLITDEANCKQTLGCCWTNNQCLAKVFPSLARVVARSQSDEVEDDNFLDDLLEYDRGRRRSRRRRRTGRARGRGQLNFGLNAANGGFGGNLQYKRRLGNGNLNIGASAHTRNGIGVSAGYNTKFLGGNLNAGASWNSHTKSPSFGLSWTKHFDAIRKALRDGRLRLEDLDDPEFDDFPLE